MARRWLTRSTLFILLGTMLIGLAAPAWAAPVPSKTAQRNADLSTVKAFLARDDVSRALAAAGLNDTQVEQRLARLTTEDLRFLASNVDQVKAAGTTVPRYIWILLGVFLGVLILTAIF